MYTQTVVTMHSFSTIGVDFIDRTHQITVPASNVFGIETFQLPQFLSVIDDNIDESDQIFALVAEVGMDVPTNLTCFKLHSADGNCHGQFGATEIIVRDNDCKFVLSNLYHTGDNKVVPIHT